MQRDIEAAFGQARRDPQTDAAGRSRDKGGSPR
jgi:hypothetical protein